MHDRDTKFTKSFDAMFNTKDSETKETAFRSPNTNAYVERYIQTLQQEVLDYFIVFGSEHMDHIVAEAVDHYHMERPHQAKNNELLIAVNTHVEGGSETDDKNVEVACRERLGGLLKHYHLKAA
jgi:hypothetical protein